LELDAASRKGRGIRVSEIRSGGTQKSHFDRILFARAADLRIISPDINVFKRDEGFNT
jgi:hypothetical protein